MHAHHRVLLSSPVFLALLTACASAPAVKPSAIQRVDYKRIDDLLALPDHPRTGALVIDSNDPSRVSDVHVQRLRTFVNDGGVVWAAGDGLDSPLVRELTPIEVHGYKFRKTSSGEPGGELIVRDASPRLVIEDHPLTAGVRQLYLFPRRKFDGTKNVQPLVRMTDDAGKSGIVIAAVPVGRGYVVLDGTARIDRVFSHLPGFDEDHPNAVKQGGNWTNYDWDRLMENASRNASS